MDRADDWDDFRSAAADLSAPATSLVYADRRGNIGYQATGAVPVRKAGHTGDFPAAGWRKAQDWGEQPVPAANAAHGAQPAVRV